MNMEREINIMKCTSEFLRTETWDSVVIQKGLRCVEIKDPSLVKKVVDTLLKEFKERIDDELMKE